MVTIIQCDLLHVKSNMVSASCFTPLKLLQVKLKSVCRRDKFREQFCLVFI